ncbi:MAG: hypothetical protein ACXV8G_01695 [Acidimicrobiales bacterium]
MRPNGARVVNSASTFGPTRAKVSTVPECSVTPSSLSAWVWSSLPAVAWPA